MLYKQYAPTNVEKFKMMILQTHNANLSFLLNEIQNKALTKGGNYRSNLDSNPDYNRVLKKITENGVVITTIQSKSWRYPHEIDKLIKEGFSIIQSLYNKTL